MAIDKINSKALVDCSVAAADIQDGTITTAKLASTLDISSKTVTLPNTSVTNAQLAGSIANAKLSNSSVTINGTAIALGASGTIPTVSWQAVVTGDTTMVAGRGYFVNTTSGAVTMTLPSSASAGDTIAIKDYAATFATNNMTIARNGHNIQGVANDSIVNTNKASLTLVYVDSTKGWLYSNESNVSDLFPTFIEATGGTVTTSGDFKIHTFTGDGCFVVSSIGDSKGNPAANKNNVSYLVVAGGGGGGYYYGSGGGAGGFREYKGALDSYTASPLNGNPGGTSITVSAQTYPITVGAGGAAAGASSPGGPGSGGSNSVFSTVTSAGGGAGNGTSSSPGASPGGNGGSGGGGSGGLGGGSGTGGSGNTPPVSPPQGNPGSSVSGNIGGGGGGATAAGESGGTDGGAGAGTGINPSPCVGTPGPSGPLRYFAGGGGGGASGPHPESPGSGGVGGGGNNEAAGTANTGGGGGSDATPGPSKPGGKGIVIIRYKYQ